MKRGIGLLLLSWLHPPGRCIFVLSIGEKKKQPMKTHSYASRIHEINVLNWAAKEPPFFICIKKKPAYRSNERRQAPKQKSLTRYGARPRGISGTDSPPAVRPTPIRTYPGAVPD